MEKEFEELIFLSYKNRFSIYYKPGHCLIRTYFKNGSQHKEIDETMLKAINKMINFLKNK